MIDREHRPTNALSNCAIVPISEAGAFAVHAWQASGTVHLIVDVSGYFEYVQVLPASSFSCASSIP